MERIRIIDLSKSFGVRTVFERVSFELKRGDRIGLVGPNGAGKSTLMKCILGIEEADGGTIIGDGLRIGYLEQDTDLGDDSLEDEIKKSWEDVLKLESDLGELARRLEGEAATESDLNRMAYLQERLEWSGGYDYEAKSRRIAYGLGFSESDLEKPASAFSGGQKTRINLAKALVRQPDFLFLDEPTNHLDTDMLDWLESYLVSYGGGILTVSHDRYFLDRIATGIVDLEHGKAVTYRGNYSKYLKEKGERLKAARTAYDRQQAHIKKTEAYIDKYRAGIKSRMARGRQSQLDRLERLAAPETSDALQFSFPEPAMSADKVVVADRIAAGYGVHTVFEGITFMIRRGESVALIGPNGAGKSTLVKAITGDIPLTDGYIDIGSRVQIGYFSQEHEELHEHWRVIDEITNDFSFSEEKARNVLGMFLFKGDDAFKLVGDLSGGERARLALLKLFLQGDNLLILDEPTNHLDIPTREIVEEELMRFGGTYLVISHDRYFLDKIARRTLHLESGVLTQYEGNYSYVKEKIAERAALAAMKDANRAGISGREGQSGGAGAPKRKADSGETDAMKKNAESGAVQTSEEGTDAHVPEASLAGNGTDLPVRGIDGKAKKSMRKTNAFIQAKLLAEAESEIARAEATMKMLEHRLAASDGTPESYASLAAEMDETKVRLESLYDRWAELSEAD